MTTKAKTGDMVSVHYIGTFNDGTQFDSSREREKTLDFRVGSGQMIPGFDTALQGMTEGETKKITLTPAIAYGEVNPAAVTEVPKTQLPGGTELFVGKKLQGRRPDGQPIFGSITEIKDASVMVDMNHPLAGKDLNFEIELVSIYQE